MVKWIGDFVKFSHTVGAVTLRVSPRRSLKYWYIPDWERLREMWFHFMRPHYLNKWD